ncbi:MAG: hypothetical protein FWC97_05950 [Treponema sp.]|nr:hypothetical protein [Treponema sp.]
MFFVSCIGRNGEVSAPPPLTSPLSRDYIGFGVITTSFTHISAEPAVNSPSIGYLRRGSLVKIARREIIRTQSGFVTWVLTGDIVQGSNTISGWLREDVMDIFNNENQARTASEFILR